MTLRHSSAGFTLIELMAVVAIVAVLLIVALPAYQNQVLRGHRSAAKAEILEIADREQQFLLANRAYTDDPDVLSYVVDPGVATKYTFSIDLGTGVLPSYTITFTPIAGTIVADDGWLSLTSEGEKESQYDDKWGR